MAAFFAVPSVIPTRGRTLAQSPQTVGSAGASALAELMESGNRADGLALGVAGREAWRGERPCRILRVVAWDYADVGIQVTAERNGAITEADWLSRRRHDL